MTEFASDLLVALAGALAAALIGGVGYLVKRRLERPTRDPVDDFIDRFERLRTASESSDPPLASSQELQTAASLVESKYQNPSRPDEELLEEVGVYLSAADIKRIGGAQLADADAAMRSVAGELMGMYDGGLAEAFSDALLTWDQYRHNYVAYVAEPFGDATGHISELVYAASAEQLTKQFHEQLLEQLRDERRRQGL